MKVIYRIDSFLTYETGRWDDNKCEFVDRKKRKDGKVLFVTRVEKDEKVLVQFIGGPTGFEQYYLEDLKESVTGEGYFCLCGGTINSWPNSMVRSADLKVIIDKM